jgi:hypothetical protein
MNVAMGQIARTFALLADETRLRLVSLLALNTGQDLAALARATPASPNALAHQLALLRLKGVVDWQGAPGHQRYFLRPEFFEAVREWFNLVPIQGRTTACSWRRRPEDDRIGRGCDAQGQLAFLGRTRQEKNMKLTKGEPAWGKPMARRGRPRVSLTIPEDIQSRYETGELTGAGVAQLCGVSTSVALRELRRAGADTSLSSRRRLLFRRNAEVIQREQMIVRLYQKGLSLSQIGVRVSRTPGAVRRVLLRENIPLRPRGPNNRVKRSG